MKFISILYSYVWRIISYLNVNTCEFKDDECLVALVTLPGSPQNTPGGFNIRIYEIIFIYNRSFTNIDILNG